MAYRIFGILAIISAPDK